MAGSTSDKISRATDSSSARPIIATLTGAGKGIGAASVTLSAATNWTTTTKVYVAIYTVTATGIKDPTSQTDWTGTLAGTTLSNLTLTGGTDRAYTAGAYCEITYTAAWAKDNYDWSIAQHKQTGAHSAITADSITNAGNYSQAAGTHTLPSGVIIPNYLQASTGTTWAWQSWTPTFTNWVIGTGGSAGTTAKYAQIGKTVHARVVSVLGTSGQAVGTGVTISLPVPAAAPSALSTGTASFIIGTGSFEDNGTGNYIAYVAITPGSVPTTANIFVSKTDGTYGGFSGITASVPFAWGSGDVMTLSFSYEAS
jgi:hypothetical protein